MRLDRVAVAVREDDVTNEPGVRKAKDRGAWDRGRRVDVDPPTDRENVALPVSRERIGQEGVCVVVAAIKDARRLEHAPRHELGAVPRPVPLTVRLRRDYPEVVRFTN